jgi:hypothetical protein
MLNRARRGCPEVLLLAASILLPFVYILVFVRHGAGDIVLRDDMYLISGGVVEKFCAGTLTFSDLWRAAANTRLLGYNLLLIANTAWFGLNSRLTVLLIPFFLLASAVLIYKDFRRSLAGLVSPAWIAGIYSLPMLALFNVALWEGLSFEFGIIFIWSVPWFIASYYAIERALADGRRHLWLAATLFTGTAVLVFGQTASFAYIAALAATVGVNVAIHRGSIPRIRIAFLGAFIGLLVFLYMVRIGVDNYFPDWRLMNWSVVTEPWNALIFVLASLSASVVGINTAQHYLPFEAIVGIGLLVACLYLAALLLYFRARMHERTYLPLLLIFYSLAFIGFMTVGRFEFGLRYGMASRYTCNSIYGILAIVWIALFAFFKRSGTSEAVRRAIPVVMVVIFAGIAWTAPLEWKMLPERRVFFENRIRDALTLETATDQDLIKFEERPDLVRNALSVLKRYRLNAYRKFPQPSSQLSLFLGTGGAARVATDASSEQARTGYAVLGADTTGVPYGTAIIRFHPHGEIVSETAIPAVASSRHVRVFVDFFAGSANSPEIIDPRRIVTNTGIGIANLGAGTATIRFTLRDSRGTVLAAGTGTMAPSFHISKFIHELSEIAPDFRLPEQFTSTASIGSLDIESSQPIAAAAIRLRKAIGNEMLVTTVPVADLDGLSSESALFLPQFAVGGGYGTCLLLLNASNVVENGNLRILDDDGNDLRVVEAGGAGQGSEFRYSIQPGGVFRFRADESSASSRFGWMKIIPEPHSPAPAGIGTLSFSRNGIPIMETGIPLAVPTTHARIYLEQTTNHETGLSLANASGDTGEIALAVFQPDGSPGSLEISRTLSIAGNGHLTGFSRKLFEGLPAEFSGVLDISSATAFAALSLRSYAGNRAGPLFTAFAAADLTRRADSAVFFPQIVDAGGYSTEFLLLNPGSAVSATLSFIGPDGRPAAIGR